MVSNFWFLLAIPVALHAQDDFAKTVKPVLQQSCSPCHAGTAGKGPVNFLTAATAKDVEAKRGLWRNVANQMRNRTMPPVAGKLSEQDRLAITTWIDADLRKTACSGQDYAGTVATRRLNRREYRHTVLDLLGVDLDVSELFPEDGTSGEGFDTNGETLYIAPLLMERYLQAAQQIVDKVIITPGYTRNINGMAVVPVKADTASTPVGNTRRMVPMGEEAAAKFTVPADGSYTWTLMIEHPRKTAIKLPAQLDGHSIGDLSYPKYDGPGSVGSSRPVMLTRGEHTFTALMKPEAVNIIYSSLTRKKDEPTADQRALHYRLFGMEPGQAPLDPRNAAGKLLARVLREAYRRPVTPAEVDLYMKLYDRVAERGDFYEERIKLALKAVLVSPKFLFRMEESNPKPGIHPVTSHELATRLSYFLWSTKPDAELSRLADEGRLQDTKVLIAQVDRLLDDPRSRTFSETFVGQWLGTKDVGIRVVPAVNDLQDFYTPEVAADLREEPILMFHYMLSANRPLLDFLDAKYSFLTSRLVKYYQLEDKIPNATNDFQKLDWPDAKRGGVFGLGSVLAMTSHAKDTSPVLRGAWVLENILGVTVPPPPPDVPPLDASGAKGVKMSVRQKLEVHRANATCAACHNLIDPIGLGLENFDQMGRWREKDNGQPVDASSVMPSGEKFNGPIELRKTMLAHKDEFIRTVTGKMLGYALGRSLQDQDQCTIQRIMQAVAQDRHGTRTLLREIVLSVPFRNAQAPLAGEQITPAPAKRIVQQK